MATSNYVTMNGDDTTFLSNIATNSSLRGNTGSVFITDGITATGVISTGYIRPITPHISFIEDDVTYITGFGQSGMVPPYWRNTTPLEFIQFEYVIDKPVPPPIIPDDVFFI